MNQQRLAAYLAARFGEPVRVTALSQAFPGLSRETWLARLSRGSEVAARNHGIVVRIDPPGGPFVPVPLFYEWQVYLHVARTPVPVAKPLWFDEAPDITDGRPLFVREMIEGSTLLPGLTDDTDEAAERRRRVALEHAEKLALLHRITGPPF